MLDLSECNAVEAEKALKSLLHAVPDKVRWMLVEEMECVPRTMLRMTTLLARLAVRLRACYSETITFNERMEFIAEIERVLGAD